MTVKNYSKIISLMIFLVALVQWDLLNIGFKCREATSLKAASEPLFLILSRSQSLKIYLSVDHNLTLNQSTQEIYTVVKLLLLTLWSVVISYIKKSFFLTLRKFLTFSVFHFNIVIVAIFCLNFNFMLVEENLCFYFFFIIDAS